ncbi:MAG: cell cycle protein, partial [Pedobacter sp.]
MIKKHFFIILISIVLGALFFTLYHTLQRNFADVASRLENGTMVNLNHKNPGNLIKTLLEKGYYFEDKKDIRLIENVVSIGIKSFDGPVDNIGELNKSKFFVDADYAFANGGKDFQKRAADSRKLLGYTGEDALRFEQERNNPPQIPAEIDLGLGEYNIGGRIISKDEKAAAGVLVRLQMILPQDSAYTEDENAYEEAPVKKRGLTAY